jgi:uncharacterized protein YjbJ (UPF0337 family)
VIIACERAAVTPFFALLVGYAKGSDQRRRSKMGERIDEAKGRTKQAAGDLTDDEKLKREGKIDRAVSTVKEKVDDAADKIKEKVGHDRDRDPRD